MIKVRFKLFATLREGREKVMDLEIEEGTVIQELFDRYGIDGGKVAICIVNGRDADYDRVLQDGDTLSLFPPVGGG